MTLVRKVKSNWHIFPACKNWLNLSWRSVWNQNFNCTALKKQHISHELKKLNLTTVNWSQQGGSQHWCAMCVQYQSSWAPKLARKCGIEHWFPCGADGQAEGGRAVYGHVISKFSGMGRFTYPWCSAGALCAPELRYHFTTVIEHFLPWYHFTAVIEHFLPWYHFTAMTWHSLPWHHFNDAKFSTLISFYCRDATFSTLILFYSHNVTFSTLIAGLPHAKRA